MNREWSNSREVDFQKTCGDKKKLPGSHRETYEKGGTKGRAIDLDDSRQISHID